MKKLHWLISLAVIGLAVIACLSTPPATTPVIPAASVTASAPNATPPSQSNPVVTPAAAMKPGQYNQKMTDGGTVRTYILHVPPGYDGSKALPLVIVLHGLGGNALSMVKSTGLNHLADQASFLVAYINGTGDPPGFNNGLMPDLGNTTDDVGFVRDLVGHLAQELRVDDKRVYATGFSNGAFMTYRLGSELSDVLAGIAVVEGTIGMRTLDGSAMLQIANPIGPIPVLIVHGKQDMNLPYEGGQGKASYVLSVADAVAFWTKADGCTGAPQEASNSANVLVTDYRTCGSGTEVILYTVVNGQHEWPTLEGHTKFSATDAIWDFFSQHTHP